MLGEDGPKWGDRVKLIQNCGAMPRVDASEILERYKPEMV